MSLRCISGSYPTFLVFNLYINPREAFELMGLINAWLETCASLIHSHGGGLIPAGGGIVDLLSPGQFLLSWDGACNSDSSKCTRSKCTRGNRVIPLSLRGWGIFLEWQFLSLQSMGWNLIWIPIETLIGFFVWVYSAYPLQANGWGISVNDSTIAFAELLNDCWVIYTRINILGKLWLWEAMGD